MRYRLMATYRGVPGEVGMGPSNSEVVLFAACPPPEELGFEPATGHWRKPVIRAEIDTLWESRPVGMFRGEACIVLDDPGERLQIAYLGTDAERATSLGYWQVDRGVFELLTPREEVTELTEERVEKPLRWGELAEVTGPMATYPYGTAPWPITAPQVAAAPLPPDAAAAEETVPGAGGPLDEAGAADVAPAEVPAAEVPAAEVLAADPRAAEGRPAVVSAADASPPGIPEASIPPAKAPVSDTPLADALLAETQRARRGAGTPRASAPLADPLADDPMADREAATPLVDDSLADDPMAGTPPAPGPLTDPPPAAAPPADPPAAPPPARAPPA